MVVETASPLVLLLLINIGLSGACLYILVRYHLVPQKSKKKR